MGTAGTQDPDRRDDSRLILVMGFVLLGTVAVVASPAAVVAIALGVRSIAALIRAVR